MDDRENLRALVDELTDEEAAEALEYLRFLIEQRRPPEGPVDIRTVDRERPRDDD
jgi:hypothetical protein